MFSMSLASKGLAFIRELLTVYAFGTTFFRDGFVATLATATLIYAPFLEPISRLLVPKYLSAPNKETLMGRFMLQLLIIMIAILILSTYFAPVLIQLVYHNLSPEASSLATHYFSLMLAYSMLFVFSTALSQIANAHHWYAFSEFRNILFSGVVIFFLWFKIQFWGIPPLFGGYFWGISLSCLVLGGGCFFRGWLRIANPFRLIDSHTLGIFWLKFGGIASLILTGVFPGFLSQHLFAKLGPQLLSANDIGLKLSTLFFSMLIPTLLTPYSSKIADMASKGQFPLNFTLRIASIFVVIGLFLALLVTLFGESALRLILQKGAMTAQGLHLTYTFFWAYMLGLAICALYALLQQIVLSYRLNKTYIGNILFINIAYFGGLWFVGIRFGGLFIVFLGTALVGISVIWQSIAIYRCLLRKNQVTLA